MTGQVAIKKLNEKAIVPSYGTEYSAGADLYACMDSAVTIQPGEAYLVHTGLSMEIPEGYCGYLLPRSSTYKNFGIIATNSMGVIDHDYCGDDDIFGLAAYALKDTVIPKDSRLCQFCIYKKPEAVEFEEVETLGNKSRGGFGSTGTK